MGCIRLNRGSFRSMSRGIPSWQHSYDALSKSVYSELQLPPNGWQFLPCLSRCLVFASFQHFKYDALRASLFYQALKIWFLPTPYLLYTFKKGGFYWGPWASYVQILREDSRLYINGGASKWIDGISRIISPLCRFKIWRGEYTPFSKNGNFKMISRNPFAPSRIRIMRQICPLWWI